MGSVCPVTPLGPPQFHTLNLVPLLVVVGSRVTLMTQSALEAGSPGVACRQGGGGATEVNNGVTLGLWQDMTTG